MSFTKSNRKLCFAVTLSVILFSAFTWQFGLKMFTADQYIKALDLVLWVYVGFCSGNVVEKFVKTPPVV